MSFINTYFALRLRLKEMRSYVVGDCIRGTVYCTNS